MAMISRARQVQDKLEEAQKEQFLNWQAHPVTEMVMEWARSKREKRNRRASPRPVALDIAPLRALAEPARRIRGCPGASFWLWGRAAVGGGERTNCQKRSLPAADSCGHGSAGVHSARAA